MDRNFDAVQIVVVVMHVALRKESVDRNIRRSANCSCRNASLSARRAWIEISGRHIIDTRTGRSPQGERG